MLWEVPTDDALGAGLPLSPPMQPLTDLAAAAVALPPTLSPAAPQALPQTQPQVPTRLLSKTVDMGRRQRSIRGSAADPQAEPFAAVALGLSQLLHLSIDSTSTAGDGPLDKHADRRRKARRTDDAFAIPPPMEPTRRPVAIPPPMEPSPARRALPGPDDAAEATAVRAADPTPATNANATPLNSPLPTSRSTIAAAAATTAGYPPSPSPRSQSTGRTFMSPLPSLSLSAAKRPGPADALDIGGGGRVAERDRETRERTALLERLPRPQRLAKNVVELFWPPLAQLRRQVRRPISPLHRPHVAINQLPIR